MQGYDVGVVGAGIHGASAAFHLASRGVRCAIFERTVPAGGPTGRSSGICRAYYTNGFLARCARDSIAMFADFRELTGGGDAGLRRTGMLYLHPPEDVPDVRRLVERQNRLGIATELLTPEEAAARFPGFDLEGIGVCAFERDAGYADPAGATAGLFRRAVELGAVPRVGVTVRELRPRAGGGAVVVTDAGEAVECARLLVAAGPWTRPLLRQLGVDLPLRVERHVVAVFRWGEARPVQAHADLAGDHYFRPEGEDLYLVGHLRPAPEVDPDDFPASVAEDEVEALARLVVRRVPSLARSEAHGGWASLYDVSPDWQPVIGEVAPGVFVDAGTSGHGFKLAPALARHVVDLVLGEEPDPALAEFDALRFEQGRTVPAGYREARILG